MSTGTDLKTPAGTNRIAPILGWCAVAVLLLASLVLRLVRLDAPLIEHYAFRQTQTANTVYWFLQEGFHPLHYQTPVLGPPWRIPFEFPTYQLVAGAVAKTGLLGLDASCRITNIAFFYLSAAMLYLLCRRVRFPRPACACVLLSYVWFPLTLVSSRTALIDYTAVAFGLAYAYCFLLWLEGHKPWITFPAAIVLGTLAYLTKVTVITTVGIILVGLTLIYIHERRQSQGSWAAVARSLFVSRQGWALWLCMAALVLVPVAVEYAWLRYTDYVKVQSPATIRETSAALKTWNFTTLNQITQFANWRIVFSRVHILFLPGSLVILPLFGCWSICEKPPRAVIFFCSALAGGAVQVAVHFNLYVIHDYYLMGISPCIALAAGMGVYGLIWEIFSGHRRWLLVVGLPLFLIGGSVGAAADYVLWAWRAPNVPPPICAAVASACKPDEYPIILDDDWSSQTLYYARRKGLMIPKWLSLSPALADMIVQNNFVVVVCKNPLPELFALWKHSRLERTVDDWSIYRVSNGEIPEPEKSDVNRNKTF